jgi:hypothetical protein
MWSTLYPHRIVSCIMKSHSSTADKEGEKRRGEEEEEKKK